MQTSYHPDRNYHNYSASTAAAYYNPIDLIATSYSMPPPPAGQPYDKIVEYRCNEPDCPLNYGITLQDYVSGMLSESDLTYLVELNTDFKCPTHNPTLRKAHILHQWEIPAPTLFSYSIELHQDQKTNPYGKWILCPDKDCDQVFKTRSDFKRHLATIFRPFLCLRGNCCVNGQPCRKGFGRSEEIINHLKNPHGQHHDAVRHRPVEGWDFRKKNWEEIDEVMQSINFRSKREIEGYYLYPETDSYGQPY